ncbi:TetR/AcrR family transcriptional regulator [Nitrosopumilus sp.]|uniref:TetR/AcrR family transcriptional regulator n=1 Tax=Nitrosopumilus sp. TaxID=2024843 RepID=UPI002931119E|nr:TetR/AcrR family transcriptional regulator [Nitrosopumilus sp.]
MKRSKTKTVEKPPTPIKKKIMQIATKKFAKNGYQKTSMNEIVESAKVSKGALLHHFHTKEDLFFVVFSQNVDLAFKKIFELISSPDFKLFEKRENLFEDLKKYYDLIVADTKEFERLWLEGIIESANNPKLRQMMIKKDKEIAMIAVEMLKGARSQIGILDGYDDSELLEVARGVGALWRGIFLDKMAGKSPKEIRNTFARMLYNVYSSKK